MAETTLAVPVLPAKPSATGRTWLVPCEFCRSWHTHAPEAGDRAAHCFRPSPYEQTGYVIVLDPKAADELAARVLPKRRRAA